MVFGQFETRSMRCRTRHCHHVRRPYFRRLPQRLIVTLSSVLFLLNAFVPDSFAIDQVNEKSSEQPVEEQLVEADQLIFARDFVNAVVDGDHKQVDNLIDWSEVVDLATAGEDKPDINRMRVNFKRAFLGHITQQRPGSYSDLLIQNSKNGGTYKFLKLENFENEPVAMFRLMSVDRAVNYHRYYLKRSKDGLVRARDIHTLLSAGRSSEAIQRLWLSAVEESTKSLWDRFTKPPNPLVASLKPLEEMRKFVQEGQVEKALEVYKKSPEAVQKMKFLLLLRIQATHKISDEEYCATIDDCRKYHPNDASLDLILIDGYFLKKQFDKALECVNRVNESIGGDAWMVALRASMLENLGKVEEAMATANQAIQMEPDLIDLYSVALHISLVAKNHDETAEKLTLLESMFQITFEDLTQIPEYADFVLSPQYQKWMESTK